MKVSSKIYEKAIIDALLANAGEDDPDPETIKEIQKSLIQFIQNILLRAHERSIEKDKIGDRIYSEDILMQFKNQPKYFDACAKKILLYQYGQTYKNVKRYTKNVNDNDIQEEEQFSSNEIDQYNDIDKE